MLITHDGEHGLCVIGESYAQGDRRDLGKLFMTIFTELTNERMRTRPTGGSDDLSVVEAVEKS